ncbi:hypothetical protein [Mesorhizobium sp.]|uniref:hypothetical protein n=1 Tax=Mesorhizobium sp. TaxID=1871066 RepID=UPI00121744E5|nr:hypothetical protein [Mesorhizobium sp.]TIQ05022.1 MAG: hypothetical protein E5X50_21505 [Mesorhizobium sp.]TIR20456.1 MAG: hypothetical protein E5X33_16745 [Mesorhizobium sp.]
MTGLQLHLRAVLEELQESSRSVVMSSFRLSVVKTAPRSGQHFKIAQSATTPENKGHRFLRSEERGGRLGILLGDLLA